MRKLVLAICLAVLAITGQQASAQTETVWTGWGQAKYAESKDAAVLLLPDALAALDVPEPVRVLFQQAVKDNPDGNVLTPEGKIPHLNAGDRFKAMMSGPDSKHVSAHVMVNVVVGTIPVKGKTGVHEAAEARVWRVEYEGQEYFLVLPTICNNWAWRVRPLPPKEENPPDCVELRVPKVHAGDRMTLEVRAEGHTAPLPLCLPEKPAEWDTVPDCLTCFDAHGPSVFLVPRKVAENYEVLVCWEHKGKPSIRWVVETKDWIDGAYEVPDLETMTPQPKTG